GEERYLVDAGFRRSPGGLELRVDEAFLHTGILPWTLVSPASVRIVDGRLLIDGVNLVRSGGEGRIRGRGTIPFEDPAARTLPGIPLDFDFEFDGVQLSDVLRVARPDLDG